ncbi:MAG: hypothetical protein R3F59_08615 [Myxococcota bacterium]
MRRVLWLALAGCQAEYAIVAPVDVHPDEVTECAFEAVDGAPEVERYTCNPVFVATDEPWAEELTAVTFGHTNVLDHPFYQLWYFARTDDGPTAGYATSPDGTSFAPHPDNPQWPRTARDAWDGGLVQNAQVTYDRSRETYLMLYGGISRDLQVFGLGVATSPDGQRWATAPTNPVLDLRLLFGGVQIAWPMALEVADDGEVDAYMAATADGDHLSMYRFATDDPAAWLQPGEEVFGPGKAGRFDDQGLLDAAVVELDGVSYLFYVGFGRWEDDPTKGVRYERDAFLGVATSTDGGHTWTRDRTDPLPVQVDPAGSISAVTAQVVGSHILLWVSDVYPEVGPGVGYFVYTPEAR